MGQQQLLLLVLGIVIVGIAVVAGIQAFSEGKAKAEQDAAVSDAMRFISDVQAWSLKPTAFGGGQGVTTAPKFNELGYNANVSNNNATYRTVNGCYTLGSVSGDGGGIASLAIHRLTGTGETPVTETVSTEGVCGGDKIADVNIVSANTNGINWTYASN